MSLLICLVLSYLIGSIPTAVWVGLRFHGLDVREHGSKNAGATNTFRVLGKKPGVIVLLIDVLKGIGSLLIPLVIFGFDNQRLIDHQIICSLGVIIGHLFPLYAGFRGGKGVATSLGVIIAIQPRAALICMAVFLIVFLISNYVSLGAIITSFCFPIQVIFFSSEKSMSLIIFSIVIALVVIFAHRKNIGRIISGTESKMYLIKKI